MVGAGPRRPFAVNSHMGWLTCVANRSSLTSSSEFLSAPSSVFADGGVQVRSLLRSHSQGERSRASLAPGLYHPSPSIFSPSWSDRQGAVDDGAITGLRMRRSSAVRRPTPCHFSSLSSLLVHPSLFFRPTTVAGVGGSLWTTIISTILCTGVKEDSTTFPHVLVVADSSRLSFLFFSNLASFTRLMWPSSIFI